MAKRMFMSRMYRGWFIERAGEGSGYRWYTASRSGFGLILKAETLYELKEMCRHYLTHDEDGKPIIQNRKG